MARLYLDTSAAVPLFVRETETDRMRSFLQAARPEEVVFSNWVTAEVAGVLSTKVRTGALNLATSDAAAAQWEKLRRGFTLLPISDDLLEKAASLAGRHDLVLRAADALHLAIARAAGCNLVTLDVGMGKAALQVGVPLATLPPA